MMDQNQLDADQAALATQQAADDAARAALAQADTDLATAKAKLVADTAAYDAEQAEIAAHPVMGVFDQMEKAVADFASQVGVGVSDTFRALIEKARALVTAEETGAPAAPADPVPASATAVAQDTQGSVGSTADQGTAQAAPAADAQGTVVAAADSGAALITAVDASVPATTGDVSASAGETPAAA